MNEINALIQPSRPTIAAQVEQLRAGDLFVDDSFQRRLVWTERQKVRLIETVMIGYPMPEIYLWQQEADADSGKQRLSVVDGQQRLTTMLQFVSNEWPLKAVFLDRQNRSKDWADKFWKDLASETKRKFWDYVLNARIIPSSVSGEEISAIFRRLNETDKSLNPQELRNAAFSGKFLNASKRITLMEGFKKMDSFRDMQIRRMRDIEFASSLLMYLRFGLIEENGENTNKAYDMFNDNYEAEEEDLNNIANFFGDCWSIYFRDPNVKKLFTVPVHLFTLFGTCRTLEAQGFDKERLAEQLSRFVETYRSGVIHYLEIEKYREGAKSRTRSRASRALRMNNLLAWVNGRAGLLPMQGQLYD